MKKIILSLALVAFIGSSSIVIANTQSNKEVIEQTQDGKKKAKATKKKNKECKTEKVKSSKNCNGNEAMKTKDCCSQGKTAKKKNLGPKKK